MGEELSLKAAQLRISKKDVSTQQESYVSLISTFNLPSFTTLMAYTPDGSCWIQYDGCNDVRLTDMTGNPIDSLTCDEKITGMDFQNEGDLFICVGNQIKHAKMPNGDLKTFVYTKYLKPRDLCVSSFGDVYVTFEDKPDYNLMSDNERIVIKYSAQGREKARSRYDQQGNYLFVRPSRIMVDSSGEAVYVINYTDQCRSHVVVLNSVDLTLRLRYLGNGEVVFAEQTLASKTMIRNATKVTSSQITMTYTPTMKYAVTDIGLDAYDNILLCEFYSRSVQLLTSDFVPMLTILPTQLHAPLLIAVSTSVLWVGFKDGSVAVYTVHCALEPETVVTHL
ncbi:uncharacterized protein LOC132553342 [Ylistrum balloti]|uniref:uncharacterized protein LOC132553342 n=1 Tax=Ylistrum balloti TaxID=509963 RepID=UPI002905D7D5|nr:uncharacterized protein LOC132553342 [Ylistrum balloti]